MDHNRPFASTAAGEDSLPADDIDHLTGTRYPDEEEPGATGHIEPWGTRRSPRIGAVAEAWYRAGRYGHGVTAEYTRDRLTADEVIVAGAFRAAGAEVRGVTAVMPDLPPTPLERELRQARQEAARWHRWQTVRTVVWFAMLVALVTNAAMLLA